jgi:RNA polymerase sigma-70 factor (ECF subfamily)
MTPPPADDRLARARRRFPDLDVPEGTFAAWLAEREKEGKVDHVEDLYLACACASGNAAAMRAFDEMVEPELAGIHRRFAYLPAEADDFRQLVYEKLFAGEHAKIGEYAGRGELRTWVRVALTRLFLNAATRETRELPVHEDIFMALRDAHDPETQAIRRANDEAIRQAFGDAVDRIGYRDRNLLRYAIVEGLGVANIAKIYSVHRATAARWLGDAKDAIRIELRGALKERLAIDESEVASILRAMQSQLDLTLSFCLVPPP